MSRKSIPIDYPEEEIVRRREAALKRMLATPPKPHSEMKLGKSKDKVSKKKATASDSGQVE
ncbi:MAG: hypothetical protein DLM68_12145 [Hyphomicrobiales bacterium]|nr:MAG: hypothetical protein DLM68_12145 [Hyphomicrobiales bacterium]